MARKDPIAHLAFHRQHLPDGLRREILRLGPAAIPRLLELATAPAAWTGEEPAATAGRHALELLATFARPDADAALVAAYDGITDLRSDAFMSCVRALGDAGSRLVEPLLARAAVGDERASAALEALLLADVTDERIDPLLRREFDRDAENAMTLAIYAENPCLNPLVEARLGELASLAHPTQDQAGEMVYFARFLITLGGGDEALLDRIKFAIRRVVPEELDE